MVSGTVLAVEAGAPLAGASVVLVGTARTVLTNAQGQYRRRAPPGTHTVRTRLIGYPSGEQWVSGAAGQTATAALSSPAIPPPMNRARSAGARPTSPAPRAPTPC